METEFRILLPSLWQLKWNHCY